MKDFIDKFIALILIITLFPILIVIGFLVRINLGKPILFIQSRPGYKTKIFNLIKFRTMKNDINSENEVDRLTPFGNFLRKTSLDELPSLFNILKGELSFIGPRPLLKEYLKLYSDEQIGRHNAKPGLSGWAQVNGRNNINWEERFKLDLWYIKNQSFVLDFKILIMTFIKVLIRKDINPSDKKVMPPFKGTKNY